jgi:hypothetical protein
MRGGIPPLSLATVVWCLIEHKCVSAFVLRKPIQGVLLNLFFFMIFFPISRIRIYKGGGPYDMAVSVAWVMTW